MQVIRIGVRYAGEDFADDEAEEEPAMPEEPEHTPETDSGQNSAQGTETVGKEQPAASGQPGKSSGTAKPEVSDDVDFEIIRNNPDEESERINIPANPRHYWRYRMHLTVEQLMNEHEFNNTVRALIQRSGRADEFLKK